MKTWTWAVGAGALVAAVALDAAAAPKEKASSAAVRRGEYLVTIGGCNDCHTPKKMGPKGPEDDTSRLLSGHPQQLIMPEAPKPVGPWIASLSATFTAFAGPWGTSFTANLTPDEETGLGKWTAQNFIEAMRTGRHMGRGRPILPPMPWPGVAKMTDADLKATFAYLRSIPAIRNQVPEPVAPPEAGRTASDGSPPAGPPTGTGAAAPPPGK